ncbi:hypothetical protein NECID01_0232 [Nematocida sp. AWRm77]|nr:hypothetical protein NECID01_0232 [Nematocida sp. AWRm77]
MKVTSSLGRILVLANLSSVFVSGYFYPGMNCYGGGYGNDYTGTLDDCVYQYNEDSNVYSPVGAQGASGMGGCSSGSCGLSDASAQPSSIGGGVASDIQGQTYPSLDYNDVYNNQISVATVASSSVEPVSSVGAVSCAGEGLAIGEACATPITVTLNGSLPVDVVPVSLSMGGQTYPIPTTSAPCASVEAISAAGLEVYTLSGAAVDAQASKDQAAINAATIAGTTSSQAKKEQAKGAAGSRKGKSCKTKKRGGAAAAAKKKNGAFGVTALVSLVALPLIALIM